MFKIKLIETEVDYEKALIQLRKLRGTEKKSDEYNLREVLKLLVINYEKEKYPFGTENFDQWANSLQENNLIDKKEELHELMKLSENSFSKDWDNKEDEIYDDL